MTDIQTNPPAPTPPSPAPRRPRRLALGLLLLGVIAALAVGLPRLLRPAEPHVLVVGIDGADWQVIDRLIADGALPNLARLKKEGAHADLLSQEPVLSPILWTTIATGKKPDKHGVTWFMVDNPKTGGRMPITSNIRKVKAFWNILTERDLSVGVLGWWATFPAEAVKGFVLSDFLAFHGFGVTGRQVKTDLGKTFPPDLLKTIEPKLKGPQDIDYPLVHRFIDISEDEFKQMNQEKFDFKIPLHHFRNILATAVSYRDIALEQIQRGQPRVMAVYFEGVDSTSHLFMQHAPPQLPWISDADFTRYGRVVDEYYKFQDEILGQLLAAVDRDTTVIICSDHGFKTGQDRPRQEQQIDVANAHKWHRLKGVLLAHGPSIRAGARIERASIMDITPTLLYALGLPKGEDMDGAVLTDLFEPDYLKKHPVETIPTYEGGTKKEAEVAESIDPSVAAEAEERLRALGYIGDSDQSSSEVHDNEGAIQLREGKVEEAMDSFEKAVRMDPLNPGPHVSLGLLYKDQGRFADAVREMEFALKLKPDAAGIRSQLGDVYFAQKNWEDALAQYQKALAQEPKLTAALIGVGNVSRMKGDDRAAREAFLKAAEAEPGNFVPHYNLGVIAQGMGDMAEARSRYEKAIAISPRQAVVHNNLGNLLEREGDIDGAVREYRAAVEADAKHFESRYNLGTVLLRKGDLKGAEKALKDALALQPDSPFAHNNLATVYLRLGWAQKAFDEYQLLMRLAPDRPNPYYQASRIMAAAGRVEEARKLLRQAVERGGKELKASASQDPVFQKAGIKVDAL